MWLDYLEKEKATLVSTVLSNRTLTESWLPVCLRCRVPIADKVMVLPYIFKTVYLVGRITETGRMREVWLCDTRYDLNSTLFSLQ